MKTHRILLLTALLALPGLLPAQTVPEFISYQGRVLDSAGAAVGTGTPVNRTVIFRVWDHQSNTLTGNLIYSEQQTVTIADGKFSVLVGQGVATTGTPFSYSETSKGPPTVSIANAFNGSGRYLGVTVDDGTAAVDNEIAPRQQVVSSAFAFRSKFAETLNGGTITGTVTATGGTFTGGTFTGGTFSGTGSNLTALNATSLSSGTVNDARLSSNVALLNRSPQTFTGATNIFNGGVGIGTAAPQTRLHVNGGDLRVDSGSNVAGAGGAINFGYADTGTAPPMAMVKGLLSNSRGDGLQGGLAFYIRPYRTKDLTFRTFRNEALEQYRTLFDLASRYTFLAAKSYDYETGLLGTPHGRAVINKIVASRSLGDLTGGIPQATVSTLGDAGLAGTMAQMNADFSVAEGRLGINNPDQYGTLFSLRHELYRILDDPGQTDDDQAWQQTLEQSIVPSQAHPAYRCCPRPPSHHTTSEALSALAAQ